MTISFPSREYDHAVAAVCHGTASEAQQQALNELLRSSPAARDEYILRVELHSRLASDPSLFTGGAEPRASLPPLPHPDRRSRRVPGAAWVVALAACAALLITGLWMLRSRPAGGRMRETSTAIAMLGRVVDARWEPEGETPRLGAPLEPGRLRLGSGLAQIVFYSGARVVIEGPAEFQLISPGEAALSRGRLVAEVPPQARGFRVRTPRLDVTDLGTVFGVDVQPARTELHVFRGRVELQSPPGGSSQGLIESQAALVEGEGAPRILPANRAGFASLFDFGHRSTEAEVLRHEQWRAARDRLDEDPSLLVHFDFEPGTASEWLLANRSRRKDAVPDATVVGCQWAEGRWPDKQSLEFRGVSDRVRFGVPGEFDALTLAVWLRVHGLDRQINSLFMSDGFEPGTLHWSIRNDGVLGLTAIGSEPGEYQICASPPQLTLDQFGLWVHLAVVIDGSGRRVTHYFNGVPVAEQTLKISPPFRIGVAELGNWNALGFPKDDPFMIRHFSGAMDEFCLFSRPLNASDIRSLYTSGRTQTDPLTPTGR